MSLSGPHYSAWLLTYHHYDDPNISLKGMIKMLENLPLLEELKHLGIPAKGIEIVGRHCPHLKSFTFNQKRVFFYNCNPTGDKQALAFAKSMPGFRHLQLFGKRMTITGLMAILNNCHHLEYLDVRQCFGLYKILKDEPHIEAKLRERVKHVRFPEVLIDQAGYNYDDSTYDYDEHKFENSTTYDSDDGSDWSSYQD